MKKWIEEKILMNNKKTLLSIVLISFIVLAVYQITLLFNGTYFNSNSDDVVQYSPILGQYIRMIKNGEIGWFNFSNNFGASTLADVYYVPIDIFSLLTFLLSFIMNSSIAFSVVELLKVVLGVGVFAYFLQRKKFSNKLIFILSFVYFAVGGAWAFNTYPTYFSLFFYLPLCLLVVDYFVKGKKWILPLYSVVLVLYNFYNAYTMFIFMLFVYIVVMIRDDYRGFKNLIKKIIVFGLNIVLGVVMSLFILLPSILYIINYTGRELYDFQVVFDLSIYFRMIYKLFVYEAGVVVLNYKITSYVQEQFSIYIGLFGLVILGFLFRMKDRVSKIYKWSLVVIMGMMVIPLFSMIFSGVAVAYTRWFSFLNIILIYLMGHVISNHKLSEFSKKDKIIVVSVVGTLYVLSLVYVLVMITGGNANLSSYNAYSYYFLMLFIMLIYGVLYVIFYLSKQRGLIYGVFCVEMIVSICINFSTSFESYKKLEEVNNFNKINNLLDELEINDGSLTRTYVNAIHKQINNSRFTTSLTNERSFHSFFNKNIYYFNDLVDGGGTTLSLFNLDVYRPNYSRIMDYKYIVMEKGQELSNLSKYYEGEDYVIYVNDDYEPFYVYEDYYDYDKVKSLKEEASLLSLEKKLFNGIILESNEYNLGELDFNYDEEIKRLNIENKLELVRSSDNKYEGDLSEYNFDYSGTVYVKIDDKISKVTLENECIKNGKFYACEFKNNLDKIVVESSSEITSLDYAVFVDHDNLTFAVMIDESINNYDYLNYHSNDNYNLAFEDSNEQIVICLNGFCDLSDKSSKFMFIPGAENSYTIVNDEIYIDYIEDDLSYYNENKDDIFASEKSLSYNNSTVSVKYKRISDSSKDQVVVLPITYSEEWVLEDSNYELVRANGSFLGIVVKKGIEEINVSLTFKPSGVKEGVIISAVGWIIYGAYVALLYYRKKKVKISEVV